MTIPSLAFPLLVLNSMTSPTLPVPGRSPVGVLLGVFVAVLAMCFASPVWGHGESLKENPSLGVYQGLNGSGVLCPRNNSVCLEAGELGQDMSLVCDSFDRDHANIPAIDLLLFSGRPSAIGRFVMSVVVDALDGEAFWTPTHVVYKRREALEPPIAYAYPTTAIVSVGGVLGVQASLLDIQPNAVVRMTGKIVSFHLARIPVAIQNSKEKANVV